MSVVRAQIDHAQERFTLLPEDILELDLNLSRSSTRKMLQSISPAAAKKRQIKQ